MSFLNPMDDFPELQGMDKAEARAVLNDVQKQVGRQPAILGGMIATMLVVAFVLLNWFPIGGLLGGVMAGALLGAAAWAYLVYVIFPRMRIRLREMGYPRKP